MKDEIRAEGLRVVESLLWTFKQHFDAEAMWTRGHFYLGIPATAASAALGSILTADLATTVAVGASAMVAMLVATATFLRPDRRAAKHRDIAHRQRALHDRMRAWLNIELPTQGDEDALAILRAFTDERDSLEGDAPPLSRGTYNRVRRGFEDGEADFIVDIERK